MDQDIKKKYKEIALRSFETKLSLFLFSEAIRSDEDIKVDKDLFEHFTINEELINQFTTEYFQMLRIEKIQEWTIDEIYHRIKHLRDHSEPIINELKANYVQNFESVYPEKDFAKLLEDEHCHYCQITLDQIGELARRKRLYKKNERGWTLEIDRLNSNYEYTSKNCVMACYWCNNAKTDEFTKEEFKIIGEAIHSIWESRLTESIPFEK